jgi:ribosome biogenesis GTPase
MVELSSLGFGPFFQAQISLRDGQPERPARIAAEHRGAYEVWARDGSGPARLCGRLRHELGESGLPGVGDWVIVREVPSAAGTAVIERVLRRRTVFTRAAAGRETRAQVVAANVDLVLAVAGLDSDYSLRRLERYVARIGASGAEPVVVLNKADLCADASARMAEVTRAFPTVRIFASSALLGEGLAGLRAILREGETAALVGSSGAGKSTLLNALLGTERMATAQTRARDGRGCHTTTRRQLVLLPGGGLLLDTPGMRELALLDETGLDRVFGDIDDLATHCRYRDCRHDTEPGCAVRAAVEAGSLPRDHLEHRRQLEREASAYERRHDAKLRRASERVFGQLQREAQRLRRWKGGK